MKKYVTVEQATINLKAVNAYQSKARKLALSFFIHKLLIKHFQIGNTLRYGYKPNTSKYNAWKLKKYGNLPQLVVDGTLKKAVLNNSKVTDKGTVIFNVPEYGEIQIELGRDFTKPSYDERVAIKKVFIEEVKKFARNQVANNSINRHG